MVPLISGILNSGAIWLYVETLFFAIGVVILASQFYYRSITVKKAIVWALGFYIAPILCFIAWTFVGRPVFRRRIPTHEWEDRETVDALMEEDPDARDHRVMRALCATGALHCSADSKAEYLGDGTSYYTRLAKDLREAKKSISVECYIIRRDETSREFVRLLCEKASQGVEVRIIFDDYGYDGGSKAYLRQLEKAGVETALFHNMTRYLLSPKKNFRNHRKTFVIDGRIGYQGGFNIGDEYLGKGPLGLWRDAALRVEGPQAQQLLRMFADDWEYTTRKSLKGSPLFYEPEPCGDTYMQVLPGDPIDYDRNNIEGEFMAIARESRRTLWIETPYFAPPKPVLAEICAAAASGVDVRVIIPDTGDHPHVYWGNRKYASIVMASGAKVYEYHKGFIHTKSILGDGHLCSVGSANYDMRSIKLNFECNIIVYSDELGSVMRDEFLKDQSESTEYTLEMYRSRGKVSKLKTILAMVFNDQL